jgi:hypothetical protein
VKRLRAAVALTLLSVMAGGCVAAAIPVVAGGLIARDRLPGRGKESVARRKAETPSAVVPKTEAGQVAITAIDGRAVVQTGLKALPAPNGSVSSSRATGTGEAAAYSLQAYQALWNHLTAQAERRRRGETLQSVILAPGATLDAPGYAACGNKPLAVVFDIDESADKAADPEAPWRRWKGDGTDAVVATPGAVEGVEAARREGIAVIFTTRRSPEGAPGATALLDQLGFGRFEPGRTLILAGGAEAAKGDEQVRQVIAAGYCVVALVGDSLNDFSKLFEAAGDPGKRQTAATETMVAPLWGAGWFILPNPVRSVAPIGAQ